MVVDDAADGFALFGVEFEAGEETFAELDAVAGVIAGAARFASVVHEQSEEKQVEAVDFREQTSEAFFPFMLRLAEAVDVVDDVESVFVDGVAVPGIADDERLDAVKLGDDELEDAECMHGAERMRSPGTEKNFAQAVPQEGTFRHLHGEDGQRVGDAVFRGKAEAIAVPGHEAKHLEDTVGVVDGGAFGEVEAAVIEEEVGCRRRERACGGIACRRSGAAAERHR